MIRRRIVMLAALSALAVLPLGRAASAHQGQQHIMGTVKAIDDKSITVLTKGDKEVSVQLSPSTKFEKGATATTAKDVAPGARVVVHAKKGDSGLTAVLVKVGPATTSEHHRHEGK